MLKNIYEKLKINQSDSTNNLENSKTSDLFEKINFLATKLKCEKYFDRTIFSDKFRMIMFLGDVLEKYPPILSFSKKERIAKNKNVRLVRKDETKDDQSLLKTKLIIKNLKIVNRRLQIILDTKKFENIDEIYSDVIKLNDELNVLEGKLKVKDESKGIFKKLCDVMFCGCL